MLINSKFTRRSFLLLGLAPTALQAAPLVNIQNGLGLFSSHEASNINRQNRHLAFFDDPEPELMEYNYRCLTPIQINREFYNLQKINPF